MGSPSPSERPLPPSEDFARRLGRGRVLLDGAVGSVLRARGLPLDALPERWNLERPEEITRLHAAYLAAGSEVIQTNTFGGNRIVLAQHGLAGSLVELNAAAARLARDAADAARGTDGRPRWVAGNLGPCRVRLRPDGEVDPDEVVDAFEEQATLLLEHGADYLSVETMTDLREAECAVRAARSATDRAVTVCLTFDRRADGHFTPAGDPAADAARRLADLGASAVGANCGQGSGDLASLGPVLLAASPVPVIVKPNAGLPEWVGGQARYRQTPSEFARDVADAVRLGAAAAGGCCGADERFVAALARALAAG